MPAHSLDGLMKWLRRDGWRGAFSETLDEHLGPACEEAGIETSELPSILDDHAMGNLWGCAFEDFLTQEDEEGLNIVDDYLERRGWKESASDRRYMTGLRHSVMSLYEVSKIERGVSFLARDLVRGGKPVLVSEHSATKTLQQWDRIGARLIAMGGGRIIMAGGILPFDVETSDQLLDRLKSVIKRLRRARKKLVADAGVKQDYAQVAEALSLDNLFRSAAPVFSAAWLGAELDRVLASTTPAVSNSDGEDLVFVSVSFPFARNVNVAAVRAALDRVVELRAEGGTFWNWLKGDDGRRNMAEKRKQSGRGVALTTTMDDGEIVLGNIEISGRFVVLETNSVERGRRGLELLKAALGALSLSPVVQTQSVEQARQSARRAAESKPLDLPPEELQRIIHASMERHYSKQLDEPIPALDGVSPRQAARTWAGREKVIGWLKYLENNTARAGKDDPMGSFDFGWMWEELGLKDERR